MADIDRNGLQLHSDTLKVAICKEDGEIDDWPKAEIIYMTEGLDELLKKKIEPEGPISCNNTDKE